MLFPVHSIFHPNDMDADGYSDLVFAEQHQSPEHGMGVFRNADTRPRPWIYEAGRDAGFYP